MKISKLFHWLYGFVMLLPIFAVLSACLISTFNMQSKQESEIFYKYDTNDVNSVNDLVEGRIYHYEIPFNTLNDGTLFVCNGIYNLKGYEDYFITTEKTNSSFIRGYKVNNTTLSLYDGWGNQIGSFNNLSSILNFDIVYYTIDYSDSFLYYSKCVNIPIESVETNNVDTQYIFYNAIDNVKQSPLFSWAYDSFLVAPFAYIVSLFSMPANSFVVQMLSYWLAISIIWLVFDLVMYVPLLVHRWLDKGVLE